MIDLDCLKYANDNFGHGASDEYLRTVARQLQQISRSTDMVCRIGGDEFAAMFPHCKTQVILDKMGHLDRILADQPAQFPMSISYGVIYVNGEGSPTVKSLMEQADARMYVLKDIKRPHSRVRAAWWCPLPGRKIWRPATPHRRRAQGVDPGDQPAAGGLRRRQREG